MSTIVEIVLRRALGDWQWARKIRGGRDERDRRLKILLDVGPEVEPAARHERSLDVAEKCFVHDAALLVSFLPPGIGKIDVDRGETRIGKPLTEQYERVAAHHDRVRHL